MITLGIETSCDETSCAVLENGNCIRSNVISSSLSKHKPFGGVVPEIASRHCLEAIDAVFRAALRQATISESEIGLIAVTRGPGLIGSLLVGVSFAKALAFAWKKPLVGVHHLWAHLFGNFIAREKPAKPFVGLIVSGGHTTVAWIDGFHFEELGSTIDDAIGEAYDKTAKILGLGYPGGPAIDRLAQKGDSKAFTFTKPKIDGAFDMSFSGIKTAVLHIVNGYGEMGYKKSKWKRNQISDLCASFQSAVTDWVIEKTMLACEKKKSRVVAVGGGVSANSRLRSVLADECKLRGYDLYLPPLELTLDNGAMVARMGYELYRRGVRSSLDMTADSSPAFDFIDSACGA